jgi:hypothetical protein
MSIQFHIFESNGSFVAITHDFGRPHRARLAHFGSYLLGLVAKGGRKDEEVEFSLSENLMPSFRACDACNGDGRVEDPQRPRAQYMTSEFDEVDFSKPGSKACPSCRGLKVTVPDFFAP